MKKVLGILSKTALACALLCTTTNKSIEAQTLIKATGGEGLYKESIWWLDFTGIELSSSSEITQTYNIDGLYTLVLRVYDITFAGDMSDSRPLSSQRLIGYNSGNYGGDGLVKLYNIGVPNGGASVADRAQNTLYNALGFKYDGVTGFGKSGVKTNFKVEAYAYVNSSLDPVDVGLVFADAETDDYSYSSMGEYSKGTTNGSSWQMLEKKLYDNNGNQAIIISNAGKTATTVCGYNGSTLTPGNVVMMYTKKTNTSIAAPLEVDIECKGAGKSAIAIGFLLTGTDMGDAPSTYGVAQNLFFSTALEGLPANNGTYYISSSGSKGGTPVLNVGYLDYLTTPRFGEKAGDPDNYPASVLGTDANYDDLTDDNDEDGLTAIAPLTTRDNDYTLTFEAVPTPGQEAYINVWIDFNQNGSFDSSEFQAMTITEAGTYSLTWTDLSPKAGKSYIRMRIQTNVPGLPSGAYDIKMGGETEDHLLNITTYVSGHVFHDVDGLKGIIPNLVSGLPINFVEGDQLYVSMVAPSGDLIKQVPVNHLGQYEFDNVSQGDYSLVLTTVLNGVNPTLPENWIFTGEHLGADVGSDGMNNGIISLSIIKGSNEIMHANFGIEKRPDSDDQFTTIPQPTTNDTLSINGIQLPMLAGTDLEDGIYAGFEGSVAHPYGIIINALPTHGILMYNDAIVAAGDTIMNLADQFLKIVLTDTGYLNTEFQYTYLDVAGYPDLTPASYTIEWGSPLSIDFISFQGQIHSGVSQLEWTVANIEEGLKLFSIERSLNSKTWTSIGQVVASDYIMNSQNNYTYNYKDVQPSYGDNFYRIKMIAQDETSVYTQVIRLNNQAKTYYDVYPSPTTDLVNIAGLKGNESIKIYNIVGAEVFSKTAETMSTIQIGVSQWAKGIYLIVIQENGQSHVSTIKFEVK